MLERHELEKIFTSNDVINIKDGIGEGFRSRERVYYLGVNAYFGPRQTNIPHATPKYGPGNLILKLFIPYRHIVLQKKYLISGKN